MTDQNRYAHASPKKWRMNRRSFLKTALAASMASSIPLWLSCENKSNEFTLDEEQRKIVERVQEFLFPNDGNGPSAKDLNAQNYFQWVIWEKGTDKEDKEYLLKGISWVDETAEEEKQKAFLQLSSKEQFDLLELIVTTNWGESWLSMMLTIIFEALFCDPIYGGNVDEQGWKWLEHNPGQPRPTEELKLGNFLNYVKENQ